MPELPEVETVRRGLAPHLEGQRLVRVQVRRAGLRIPFPPDFVQALTGQRVTQLERRAKYLLAHLETQRTLIMHLGMSGRFTLTAPGRPMAETGPHDHVQIDTEAGMRIAYTDPRRFGVMTLSDPGAAAQHKLLRDLGIEPLSGALSGPALTGALKSRRTALKAALLDQRIVAGIGNIYACEALHRAGLSPRRLSCTVNGVRAARLADAIRSVLTDAIAAGGSSLRDYVGADGTLGYFQYSFSVYDRAATPCPKPRCKGTIERITQGGRSTFYCGRCQK